MQGIETAPRFGLCGLNIVKDATPAILKLVGKSYTGTTFDGERNYASPLNISQAQIEIYGVNINANEVNPNYSAVTLMYHGKFLLDKVDFSRHVEGNNDNSIPLVENEGSYISFMHSILTLYSNTGSVIDTQEGTDRCGGKSTVNVSEGVYPFTGYSSEIGILTCQFNSIATESSAKKPIFFYDYYDEESDLDELISQFRYCKHSKNPEDDIPHDGSYLCSQVLENAKSDANSFELMDNKFTGYWKNIFRVRWSSFPVTPNNSFAIDSDGNKLGGVESCSDTDSFSIDNNVYFDGKNNLCVKQVQW